MRDATRCSPLARLTCHLPCISTSTRLANKKLEDADRDVVQIMKPWQLTRDTGRDRLFWQERLLFNHWTMHIWRSRSIHFQTGLGLLFFRDLEHDMIMIMIIAVVFSAEERSPCPFASIRNVHCIRNACFLYWKRTENKRATCWSRTSEQFVPAISSRDFSFIDLDFFRIWKRWSLNFMGVLGHFDSNTKNYFF
jgi:hypothetical protein